MMAASLKEKRRVYRSFQQDDEMPKHVLYKKGQPDDFASPLVLVDEDEDEPDGVVAVVRDDIEAHWNAGTVGVRTTVEEGHCGRCGSNRVRVSVQEPADAVIVCCAVCKVNEHDAEIRVGGEA